MKGFKDLPSEEKPKARCYLSLCLVFALLFVIFLVFNLMFFPVVFQIIVNSQVILKDGTLSYAQWVSPTPPVYKIITMYNITNPDNVTLGGEPHVSPLGPYYFREYRNKTHVTLHNASLHFNQMKWYEFDSNKTNEGRSQHLDPARDNFTTINIAYMGIAYNLSLANSELGMAVADAIANTTGEQTLLMTRSVEEVLFGFEDRLLKELSLFMHGLPTTVQIIQNMSRSDLTETSVVDSGASNVSLLGQYTEWQGYKALPWWGSDQARTINGTEGIFFKPGISKEETLSVWTDDMYRSVIMEFDGEETRKSLETYKYKAPAYSMLNAKSNPINAGFYSFGPDGLLNLTSVVNAPIMISKPSFLDGAEWLNDEVEGLPQANSSSMDTNVWIEPLTGCLVDALKQIQVNIMISSWNYTSVVFKELRQEARYIPIALVQETGGMDEDLLARFKAKVFTPRAIMVAVLWSVMGVCALCSVAFLVVLLTYLNKDRAPDRAPIIPAQEKY